MCNNVYFSICEFMKVYVSLCEGVLCECVWRCMYLHVPSYTFTQDSFTEREMYLLYEMYLCECEKVHSSLYEGIFLSLWRYISLSMKCICVNVYESVISLLWVCVRKFVCLVWKMKKIRVTVYFSCECFSRKSARDLRYAQHASGGTLRICSCLLCMYVCMWICV